MPDLEKELQDLRKEIVEARNLVIKTDNLLKNLHADLKLVTRNQERFERRSVATGATALILFAALSAVGAYMFARSEIRQMKDDLGEARAARDKAALDLGEARTLARDEAGESARALALYERLSASDEDVRDKAAEEVASLAPGHLSALEQRALKDRARSLRVQAAADALESGKTAFNRKEYKSAAEDLSRYLALAEKPEDAALFLLGQARHGTKDYRGAVEPLQAYLKAAPNSKSADWATLLLGEALAESGDRDKAMEIYRAGADKYPASQFSPWMRSRVSRLRKEAEKEREKPQ